MILFLFITAAAVLAQSTDLANSKLVAKAMNNQTEHLNYYATARSPQILLGVAQCVGHDQYLASFGYALTYSLFKADEIQD